MTLNKKTICDSLEYHEKELGEFWQELSQLICQNPFSERIQYLMLNQHLATTPVHNTKQKYSPPNCLGTALYVAQVSTLPYPYHAYDFELNEHMESQKSSDDIFFLLGSNIEHRIPGAFVFSYCLEADWHAGIYLGQIHKEHICFSQHGHKGKFGPETLRNFANPEYYLPKTLVLDI
jgi:hypothetical protein